MKLFTKLAIAITIILAIYAFLPLVWIDLLGRFAIGWLVMDVVTLFYKD